MQTLVWEMNKQSENQMSARHVTTFVAISVSLIANAGSGFVPLE
jgi:hypothetical protein